MTKRPVVSLQPSAAHECFVLLVRLLVGGVLLTAGVAGLLAPPSELAATIRGYDLVAEWVAPYLAQGLPWIEAVLGLAVLAGLSQGLTVRAAACLLTVFWLVVGQAVWRHLPLSECGCFGALFSFSVRRMWAIDTILAGLAWWLVRRHTPTVSADRWVAAGG